MDEAVAKRIDEMVRLGVDLCEAGHLAEAEQLFGGIWDVTREHYEAASRLGVLRATRGAYAEAIEPLKAAVALDARDAVALNVLSVCFFETKDFETALTWADAAVARDRNFAEAHNSRGNALLRLGRDAEAAVSLAKALRLDPGDPMILANLANAQRNLDRPQEALANIDRALAIQPALVPVQVNRANVLQDLHRHVEALESYDRAIALDPDSVDANWNRALCQLLTGDYANGWRGYEWRWRRDMPENRPRGLPMPVWQGDTPLEGRSIVIYCEQGFGDCLQFARYPARIAALGARVVFEVYPALAELFATIPGVEVVARGQPLPPTDLQCALVSLPLALGETAPPDWTGPYLAAPEAARALWAERVPDGGAPKIGLIHSGSATNLRRSVPFEALSRRLPAGPAYHLLQKDIPDRDLAPIAARGDVTVWRDQLGSFADTAALCERMDLIVSVDTSVAHLAGALGRPLRVMLPYDPDWRWGLGSETTAWYPTARLYRQAARHDWSAVLDRVEADVRDVMGGSPLSPRA